MKVRREIPSRKSSLRNGSKSLKAYHTALQFIQFVILRDKIFLLWKVIMAFLLSFVATIAS